jgi:hypothetical protein
MLFVKLIFAAAQTESERLTREKEVVLWHFVVLWVYVPSSERALAFSQEQQGDFNKWLAGYEESKAQKCITEVQWPSRMLRVVLTGAVSALFVHAPGASAGSSRRIRSRPGRQRACVFLALLRLVLGV